MRVRKIQTVVHSKYKRKHGWTDWRKLIAIQSDEPVVHTWGQKRGLKKVAVVERWPLWGGRGVI